MKGNFAGPLIMKDEIWAAIRKDEIRAAIRKMKLGKVTCSDSISVELTRSQNYLMKTMAQVRFHQTSPNLYLLHCKETRENRL